MRLRPLFILPFIGLGSCQDAVAYAEQCGAPPAHWRKQSDGINHHAIAFPVQLDAGGGATWNGKAVLDSELAAHLDEVSQFDPLPFVILSARPETPCQRVEAIRRLMNDRYCHLRWVCGEGSGDSKDWEPVMDLPPPEELRRLEALADNIAEAAEPR